ncbi:MULTISPECIES: HemK2/MTQ2 family protein methyltransferase [Halolamina]|uniref:Release factor glutamine methyltransferase n=1 Tax=Halolamina pelagica TaxID=699431 RepID=A0A1I5MF35_9EURY|nr:MULTISPECIES: HemK2/MTQ2 family protein methyltransferase [Halolamina]NHX35994.1 methyltransferase [Halolamina sp. R1-12]SFP08133.1 release factor glutamine methyltransferase [Halolamina pelagica]
MTDEVDDGTTATDLAERRGQETKVYQPAEDSGLLADAAKEFARGRTLEVGTGSGWVAEQVAPQVPEVVAADVNPHACRQARERGIETVRTNLTDAFADGSFETVLFNPPYLPTDPENEWDDWMEQALSGGESGRELIEPFLDDLGRVLAPGGQALLLVSSLAGYEEVEELARDDGFVPEEVRQESYPFETLSILRLTRFTLCGKPSAGRIE